MEKDLKKRLIKYFKTLGIEVYTNTKARGHQGFFLNGRIDISKNTKEERIVPTLLHEFAHFIHNKLEPNMLKTGGSLEVLFGLPLNTPHPQPLSRKGRGEIEEWSSYSILNLFGSKKDISLVCANENDLGASPSPLAGEGWGEGLKSQLGKELLLVTNFVDENSLCHKLQIHKEQVKKKIKSLEHIIKEDYPKFMRSKKFKDFDKYIKKSKAKYLLKYDRVKFISPFLRHVEIFSIDKLEQDFPEMPKAYCAFIRLKSAQKKQARISSRINSLNKYYAKPTELFSRLVEGLYINPDQTQKLAPFACERFLELLDSGYYFELKNVFEMLKEDRVLATF